MTLEAIAEQYHKACDEYDKTVLTRKNERGELMPRNNEELKLVNKHSFKRLKEAYKKGEENGFTQSEILRAIQEVLPTT